MNVYELLAYVESPEFVSKVGLASGERSFLSIVEGDDRYRELRNLVQSDNVSVRVVLSRMKRLASLSYDRRYENPQDTPLAVLVLALSIVPKYGEIAVDLIGPARDGWWTSKAAEIINSAREQTTPTAVTQSTLIFALPNIRVQTSALTSEMNLGFVRFLEEIDPIPAYKLCSRSLANSAQSQFSLHQNTAVHANTRAGPTSETEIHFSEAA